MHPTITTKDCLQGLRKIQHQFPSDFPITHIHTSAGGSCPSQGLESHSRTLGIAAGASSHRIIFGVSSRIWPRLKRDRRRDGHSPFGPPGQLAKREQPGTGNEEECRRVSILVAGKGDVRVGV
ncbi:hypothetical protein DUI87_27118 [Hirundo rustica rustica]|uniref:Uncharacterized protein n=1 Tax=Hirundo rustica rustica TaxID=333673 RepID=A0A3M0JC25_HIRRU|nr:hypothetical protein DUI87_27118 [Hirundo rustica rustica]